MATPRTSDDSPSPKPLWVRGASWLLRNGIFAVRGTLGFLGPRVRRVLAFVSEQREWIYAGLERVAWWSALVLFVVAGRDLLAAFSSDADFARAPYLLGAASLLCALTLFRTSARHMRAGAFMLGTSAGALGLLGWLVQYG